GLPAPRLSNPRAAPVIYLLHIPSLLALFVRYACGRINRHLRPKLHGSHRTANEWGRTHCSTPAIASIEGRGLSHAAPLPRGVRPRGGRADTGDCTSDARMGDVRPGA